MKMKKVAIVLLCMCGALMAQSLDELKLQALKYERDLNKLYNLRNQAVNMTNPYMFTTTKTFTLNDHIRAIRDPDIYNNNNNEATQNYMNLSNFENERKVFILNIDQDIDYLNKSLEIINKQIANYNK